MNPFTREPGHDQLTNEPSAVTNSHPKTRRKKLTADKPRAIGLAAFALSVAGALAGCGAAEAVTDPGATQSGTETVGHTESKLNSLTPAAWMPSGHRNVTSIDVCFDFDTTEYAAEAGWIQDAVEGSWEQHSLVNFRRWDACKDSEQDNVIRVVKLADIDPDTDANSRPYHRHGVVYLNLTYNSWEPACQSKRETCTRQVVVHEFGHVLGFQHEQDRPDYEKCNSGRVYAQNGTKADLALFQLDNSSVMSYCNSWSGVLSAGDIVGVKKIYGGGPDAQSGRYYAIRGQNKQFGRLSPSSLLFKPARATSSSFIHDVDGRGLFKIRKRSGSGALEFRDEVSLFDNITGEYLCAGPNDSGEVTAQGGYAPCYWTIVPTLSARKGAVGINMPFRLKSKDRDYQYSIDGSTILRLLGDFQSTADCLAKDEDKCTAAGAECSSIYLPPWEEKAACIWPNAIEAEQCDQTDGHWYPRPGDLTGQVKYQQRLTQNGGTPPQGRPPIRATCAVYADEL